MRWQLILILVVAELFGYLITPSAYRWIPALAIPVVYFLYFMLNPREAERYRQQQAARRERQKRHIVQRKAPILSRSYIGASPAGANKKFEEDAALLMEVGYRIARQQWIDSTPVQVTYELADSPEAGT